MISDFDPTLFEDSPAAGPDFSDLFEEETDKKEDLIKQTFTIPAEISEDAKPFFKDPQFYQKILSGEGEAASRLHKNLAAFLKAEDPQERSIYRNRIITATWEVITSISTKVKKKDFPLAKKIFLRFGILLPSLISAEQRDMFSKIIMDNRYGESIYYVDEWLFNIAAGRITPSAQDETVTARKKGADKKKNIAGELAGKLEAQKMVVTSKALELSSLEEALKEQLRIMLTHDKSDEISGAIMPFSEVQKTAYTEVLNLLRRISTSNKELAREYVDYRKIIQHLEKIETDIEEENGVDDDVVRQEVNAVRQMAKLCVGRQGNHFPLAMKQYIRTRLEDIAIREIVIKTLADIEYLDPGVFMRSYKQQMHRIVPHIILLPSYGERGICWEPFEKYNRGTSKGRIAIPMYPRDIKTAVISAVADLRWQVAKEKAQHYWMEEGLTGWYYQYFTENKMKGDVKEQFIEDYILWINKESEGTQKLSRDARAIFWRYLPFPQEVKDRLKTRGFVYAELYKKDVNRSLSDGY
ncbi:hypothetical protein WKV44_00245 [Spirochaetia bacterium 38H-sp]|uniref:Uncharacterized protein n=1 Tax=Rarispira pelagica TaxID=3141764 RepID=A0ABU9U918_9SPIR